MSLTEDWCFQIEAVEKYGDDFTAAKKAATALKMQKTVSPKAVLAPALLGAAQIGNTRDWQLADRVICLKDTGTVPFGMRGTIVGFSENDLMVEVPTPRNIAPAEYCYYHRCWRFFCLMLMAAGCVRRDVPRWRCVAWYRILYFK